MNRKMPDITAVRPIRDYVVHLWFKDGVEREVDLEPYLEPYLFGPVFEQIGDPDYFRLVAVEEESGSIVWPNGADLAPDALYHGRLPQRLDRTD
jgi:hypothetical protein